MGASFVRVGHWPRNVYVGLIVRTNKSACIKNVCDLWSLTNIDRVFLFAALPVILTLDLLRKPVWNGFFVFFSEVSENWDIFLNSNESMNRRIWKLFAEIKCEERRRVQLWTLEFSDNRQKPTTLRRKRWKAEIIYLSESMQNYVCKMNEKHLRDMWTWNSGKVHLCKSYM